MNNIDTQNFTDNEAFQSIESLITFIDGCLWHEEKLAYLNEKKVEKACSDYIDHYYTLPLGAKKECSKKELAQYYIDYKKGKGVWWEELAATKMVKENT